jgi:hypothetical protein
MTKMDEEPHPECDVYVEDERSKTLLSEIFIECAARKEDVLRCSFISYGAASVGTALGQMVENRRFPRPTCVYLDGDQTIKPGCCILPGNDAPERVVFGNLETLKWQGIADRLGRLHSDVADACQRAITYADHKEWLRFAADHLVLGSDILWQALCSCWVQKCLDKSIGASIIKPIEEALVGPTKVYSTFPKQLFSNI